MKIETPFDYICAGILGFLGLMFGLAGLGALSVLLSEILSSFRIL